MFKHKVKSSIVFIHNKKSSYMEPVIEQAKLSNPNADVFIISDITAKSFYEKNGIFIDINDHFEEARDFEKIYVHMSPLSYGLELIFLQRWFVLKSFMLKNSLNNVVYLDSDCMLYHDVSNDWDLFDNFNLANLDIIAPAVTYIPKPNSLIKFCDFLIEQYTTNLDFIKSRYISNFVNKNVYGGIGDMSQFGMFNEKYQTTFDLSRVLNNSTYDFNVNVSINSTKYSQSNPLSSDDLQGYVMDEKRKIKKFIMKGGIPHGFLKQSKKVIKFKSIHFQGQSKRFIPYFFTGNILKKLIYIRRFKKAKY
jgi:hypothetical protein